MVRTVDLTSKSEGQRRRVQLGAQTLRRVGAVMRYVGVVGMFVALIQAMGNLSTVNEEDFISRVEKAAVVLNSYSMPLFAMLVFGVGTLGRLAADWALMQLTSEPHSAQSLT